MKVSHTKTLSRYTDIYRIRVRKSNDGSNGNIPPLVGVKEGNGQLRVDPTNVKPQLYLPNYKNPTDIPRIYRLFMGSSGRV